MPLLFYYLHGTVLQNELFSPVYSYLKRGTERICRNRNLYINPFHPHENDWRNSSLQCCTSFTVMYLHARPVILIIVVIYIKRDIRIWIKEESNWNMIFDLYSHLGDTTCWRIFQRYQLRPISFILFIEFLQPSSRKLIAASNFPAHFHDKRKLTSSWRLSQESFVWLQPMTTKVITKLIRPEGGEEGGRHYYFLSFSLNSTQQGARSFLIIAVTSNIEAGIILCPGSWCSDPPSRCPRIPINI